jgi:crotonobetainyl-CoA:carnitine CoA-transferase CaiB-like acyl-CoA transferase
VVVIDLTAIWAGPLATWLLSGLGAEVQKVEPAVRPDGFRAMDGDGIHPGGAPRDPGRDSGMWNALNHGKARLDLNLGVEDQRQEMVERVRSAHLWIDSLSPRVLPNWGFDQVLRTSPGLVAVSMPAFPVGPMRNWVAYGTGVHAVSGLGSTGPGRPEEPFWSPAVSYPDPVAGLRAALVATAGLLARSRGVATPPSEATLLGSVLPLLGAGPAGAAGPGGPSRESGAGPLFLAAAASAGILADRSVAGSDLAHPLSPLLPRT